MAMFVEKDLQEYLLLVLIYYLRSLFYHFPILMKYHSFYLFDLPFLSFHFFPFSPYHRYSHSLHLTSIIISFLLKNTLNPNKVADLKDVA